MKKIMHILFLSCLKATELIEKKLLVRLSFKEKVQLSAHKAMCDACTNYEKNSILIDRAMKNKIEQDDMQVDVSDLIKSTLSKIEKGN
jgi:membrane carboxypeptidase/penicillin-binding protein